MLAEKGNKVYSDLSTFSALTSLLTKGANGIRPLMAENDDGESFITYAVKFNGLTSKDKSTVYQLTVWCWATTYNESVAIADQVYKAIEASDTLYEYVSAAPNYNEQQEIYTEQIFNIKN